MYHVSCMQGIIFFISQVLKSSQTRIGKPFTHDFLDDTDCQGELHNPLICAQKEKLGLGG